MASVTDSELRSAPDDVIRATLIALCKNDAALRARVTGVFRVAASAGEKKRKAGEQELPEARRQKLEGLRVCIMCEKAYLESENQGKVCWHHPEESEVNEDADVWEQWAEHMHHGDWEKDTPENRKDMPEGFWYSCCDKDLTSSGCKWGRHYATIEERDNDPLRDEVSPSGGDPENEGDHESKDEEE